MTTARRPDALARRLDQLAAAADDAPAPLVEAVEALRAESAALRSEVAALRADHEQVARDRAATAELALVVRGAVESLGTALHALRAAAVDAPGPSRGQPVVAPDVLAGVGRRLAHLEAWVGAVDAGLGRPD